MPYVLLKVPISIKENLVLCDDSIRITEKAAFDYISSIREKAAAVMTDGKTISEYNPPMEYSYNSYNPSAIFIIDPDFNVPLNAEVFCYLDKRKVYIITLKESINNKKNKWYALSKMGAAIITLDKSEQGRIDYVSLIKIIDSMKINSIFVEGACPFTYNILKSGIVNSIIFYSGYNINMYQSADKRKDCKSKNFTLKKIHAKDISFMKIGKNILIKCRMK